MDRSAYICPMHPERLVCDAGTCTEDHYAEHHGDEHETAGCFVCEERVRDDFTPVFAEILLHRNVRLVFPMYLMPDGIPLQNIGLATAGCCGRCRWRTCVRGTRALWSCRSAWRGRRQWMERYRSQANWRFDSLSGIDKEIVL